MGAFDTVSRATTNHGLHRGTVKEAWNMGAVAVGATIYFGSEQSRRQIVEVSQAFEDAHELGRATILWCYLRNSSFKKDGTCLLYTSYSQSLDHV